MNRRDFIKLVGCRRWRAGAGRLSGCLRAGGDRRPLPSAPPSTGTPRPPPPFEWSPDIYLKIDQDGVLTVTAFRSEMGQGIRTATAMLVAEEVDVDWSSVRIEQAPADRQYGDQQTGGSVSVSTYYYPLLLAGAAARQMLIQAAAQTWDVKAEDCTTEPGYVVHPDGAHKAVVWRAGRSRPPNLMLRKSQTEGCHSIPHREHRPGSLGCAADAQLAKRSMVWMCACRACFLLPSRAVLSFGHGYASYDDTDAKAVAGVKQIVRSG